MKIDKSVEEILKEVGVRQGDNMAPGLFSFLMNPFADSLEATWNRKEGASRSCTKENFENDIGILRGHKPSQFSSPKLDIVTIFQCLYVDDGAFPFISREQLAHFARFGRCISEGQ